MDGNDLITRTVCYIKIFYWQVYQRLQFGNLTGNLLSCIIGHFLTKNLQCCWGNAEEQPAASGIEECTYRTYSILQLARCLLHFQRASLIIMNQRLYFLYCHINHSLKKSAQRYNFFLKNSSVLGNNHKNPSIYINGGVNILIVFQLNHDGGTVNILPRYQHDVGKPLARRQLTNEDIVVVGVINIMAASNSNPFPINRELTASTVFNYPGNWLADPLSTIEKNGRKRCTHCRSE